MTKAPQLAAAGLVRIARWAVLDRCGESLNFSDVDSQQLGANAHSAKSAGGDPTPDRQLSDAETSRSRGDSDQVVVLEIHLSTSFRGRERARGRRTFVSGGGHKKAPPAMPSGAGRNCLSDDQ